MKRYVLDTEVAPNYCLILVGNLTTGCVGRWELYNDADISAYQPDALRQILDEAETIGFNSLHYDRWIIAAYLDGRSNLQIYELSSYIISTKGGGWSAGREKHLEWNVRNHIDIKPLCPPNTSLKELAARLGVPMIQDLPFEPHEPVSSALREQLIPYCVNDLRCTAALFEVLSDEVDLRRELNKRYGTDHRSMSKPQIAERVLTRLLRQRNVAVQKDMLVTDEVYRYDPPGFVRFRSVDLAEAFDRFLDAKYRLKDSGQLALPDTLRTVTFAGCTYKFGIGGLHSQEKRQTIRPAPGEILADLDVTSYYPSLILSNGFYPATLGEPFTEAYQAVVDERVSAKTSGDKVTADVMKIVINSIFGKFGSPYSGFYDPQVLLQTTVTGQLALLMLIEMITLDSETRVVSANTDGIVIHSPSKRAALDAQRAARRWERITGLTLEGQRYRLICQQDVNNYFAVTESGKIKRKGVFVRPGLTKNPRFPVVAEAVMRYVIDDTDPTITILSTTDVLEFVCTKRVTGGGVWRDVDAGKAVRFYLGVDGEPVHYRSNGNQVGDSAGAVLVNKLPATFPADVDYHRYVERTEQLMSRCGLT